MGTNMGTMGTINYKNNNSDYCINYGGNRI